MPIFVARRIALALCKQPPIKLDVCVVNETLPGDLRTARLVGRIMERMRHSVRAILLTNAGLFSARPRCSNSRFSQMTEVRSGRVEDGRGSLGHSATLRFPSPHCTSPKRTMLARAGRARQPQVTISWAFSPMPFAGLWRVTEWPLDRPLP